MEKKKLDFKKVVDTVFNCLGSNPTVKLTPEELDERVEELKQLLQGIAYSHENKVLADGFIQHSFLQAFGYAVSNQLSLLNLKGFKKLTQNVRPSEYNSQEDVAEALFDRFCELYPAKGQIIADQMLYPAEAGFQKFFEAILQKELVDMAVMMYE